MKFPVNFPKILQNKRKALFSCMWHTLRKKQFLLIFAPFYWFDPKKLFKIIQIFLGICPFSNLLRKTNFLSISVLLSEIVTFLTKKRIFPWISPKKLKTTDKHSLAVCCSFCGEKQFLLIFVPFYWFEQKQLFKQILILLCNCSFLTSWEK